MRLHQRLILGTAAGAGLLWAGRQWLRANRRIDLRDKVVAITGSTSGLGLLIARHAAARGAKVVLNGRDPGKVDQAIADLLEEIPADITGVVADVADRDQAAEFVGKTIDRHGRLDVLVNNAGTILVGPAGAMTEADYEAVLATNFWGAFYPTQAALPSMMERGMGRIVNVSSLGGRVAVPHLLPYTVSKYALAGWSEGLRAEMIRYGIYVTSVFPMTIRTGGHTHAWFKGNAQAEYAWFSLGDTLPLASASADRGAARILDAVEMGDPEVRLGWPVRAMMLARALAPDSFAEALGLVDRFLPEPANLDAPAIRGEDLEGALPDLLNQAIPAGTRPGVE